MQKRLSFMVSEELFERIERARGDVARERWLRRAVERAWADVEGSVRVEADAPRMGDGRDVDSRPAPAEQPKVVYTDDPAAAREEFPDARVWPSERALRAAPREFRPYPKGGER